MTADLDEDTRQVNDLKRQEAILLNDVRYARGIRSIINNDFLIYDVILIQICTLFSKHALDPSYQIRYGDMKKSCKAQKSNWPRCKTLCTTPEKVKIKGVLSHSGFGT